MRPALIHTLLAADSQLAGLGVEEIVEAQSIVTRPDASYFVTISFDEEFSLHAREVRFKGPRVMTVAVHHPWDRDRDYSQIDRILNRIDVLLVAVEQGVGPDGIRVSQIGRRGRSGNLVDEGWKTISRTATYRVSYDEFAA